MSEQLVPPRGTVLCRVVPVDCGIVGIVLGSSKMDGCVEVCHGWIDNPPDAGIFDLPIEHVGHERRWRLATPEEAATVRALFLAHAKAWGPSSNAWVAADVPEAAS